MSNCCQKQTTTVPVVRVLWLTFKSTAKPREIAKVIRAIRALPAMIPQIASLHGGEVAQDPLGRGFTHRFVVSFKDQASRDAYNDSADHKAFLRLLLPLLAEDRSYVGDSAVDADCL